MPVSPRAWSCATAQPRILSALKWRQIGLRAFAMSIETLPGLDEKIDEKVKNAFEKNWNVVVWNDPINLMSYVVHVFMTVLGFNREKATKHMMEVHESGKSLVATETREKAELYHQQIQAHGLSVTIEQAT